jgi:hypothetical protein
LHGRRQPIQAIGASAADGRPSTDPRGWNVWWLVACSPDLSSAIVVEQVNVAPVPDWRAESPIVDHACAAPQPCVRVGCTVRSLERAPVEAEVRFVVDLRPDPLDELQTLRLGGGEKRAVAAEFPDLELDAGQTFGRCEIQVVGTRMVCWVKNPTGRPARFGLVARLADGGSPPPEQRAMFTLKPGESRGIPFAFDQRGRVGTCLVESPT